MAQNLRELPIDTNVVGDNELVVGIVGQIVRVHRIFFVVDLFDTVFSFLDGGDTLTGPIPVQIGSSFVLDYAEMPWFTTAPGNSFIINNPGSASQFSGRIYFQQGIP